ncbi:hypothetical protein I656_02515 [Geobacillus sp. WSUCF1]|nr:hypothetical protein I656_02515 [Geobacillus sp. WSUCF1]
MNNEHPFDHRKPPCPSPRLLDVPKNKRLSPKSSLFNIFPKEVSHFETK